MKKNYAISPQIINTIEMSNEPWGVNDSSSNFIYGNLATKELTGNFKTRKTGVITWTIN
ncbi:MULTISPECIES: hypothetical protein [Photorhabdus]|uniref:Uncharacterized protein n=1 Tax=Photorhabdus luminescens TaxID=29488 RepID=A0A1G5R2A7_PHOLU|nr:hypothetical protein SAMN02982990_02878 [Photorhabdus luminescens]